MQTIKNIEVIMVDDGSSDLSPDICDEYAYLYPNFKVIHKANGGVSSARNCGLSHATGKYVAFCDPDDFYNKDSLECFYKIAVQYPDCQLFVSGGYNLVNEFDECTPFIKDKSLLCLSIDEAMIVMENYGIGGFPWNKLFLNSIIKENHISFNEQYAAHEDKLFLLQYLRNIKRVCIFPAKIYNYYQRSDGLSSYYKNIAQRIDAIIDCIIVSDKIFDVNAYAKELWWAGTWMKVYLIKCYGFKSYKQYSNKERLYAFRSFLVFSIKYFFAKMLKLKV